MNEATSQTSYPPHSQDEKHEHGKAPFALTALCVVFAIGALGAGYFAHQQTTALTNTKTQLVQVSSDANQAKTDLVKIKGQLADSQTQLDKANSSSSDLQNQLKAERGQVQESQAQAQKAQTQATNLQSQLDSANTQTTDLQTQVKQANADSSDLRKQLDQSKAQAADLQSQLTKAQNDVASLQPLAAKARAMPVTTAFEKSFFGNSFTLHIKNQNPSPLNLSIAVTNSDKMTPKPVSIDGGATYDVKDLAPGANVSITSDGFDPLSIIAK
jgi:peptidoglycan hydrolase CwlO-like protein